MPFRYIKIPQYLCNFLTYKLSLSEFMREFGDSFSTVLSTTTDWKIKHKMTELVMLKWSIALSPAVWKYMPVSAQAALVAGDGSVVLRHFISACPFMLAFSKPTFFLYYSFNCHCWRWATVVQCLTYNMSCHAPLREEGVLWWLWRCN